MKKQITILICVFVAAAVLLGVYLIFFRTGDQTTEDYYRISENALAIGNLEYDKVTITFADSREKLDGDTYDTYICGFAEAFEHKVKNIYVEFGKGGDFCTVSSEGKSEKLAHDAFFNTLENGTRYSFNGEIMFAMAILRVTGNADGRSDSDFSVYALPGYDIDGDTVGTGNRPFVYPNISRSDVQRFTVTNKYGTYSAYRLNNTFYFENAELCSYDQEKFASFVVNCTYMLSVGKLSNVPEADLAKYGLADESTANAVIDVETLKGVHHRVIIGNKLASGGAYYARYVGKPHVYILDSSLENEILQPATVMLTANLGYSISSTNDTYDISDVILMYSDSDTTVYVRQRVDVTLPSNIKAFSSKQEIATLIHDKVCFTGAYSDWTADTKSLVGVNSSDGGTVTLEFALERYAENGKYGVKFGLVKDTAKGAVLPGKVEIQAYDSDEKKFVSVAEFSGFDQSEKSYRQYEVNFEFGKQLRYVRLMFELPTGNQYAVFDEITLYADGWDAIPKESVTGVWEVVSPANYIKKGYNYATPDASTFSEILYGMATLVGDSVVEYNVTSEDTLDKYGLKDPAIGLSYDYKGYRSYIYFSKPDSDGSRFAYATIEFKDDKGETQKTTTGIIAKVSKETAPWLSWEPLEFLDRSTFSMYIDKIDTIEMEFDNTTYLFNLEKGSDGKLSRVTCNGKEVDLKNFRYLYVSVLSCTRAGEYTPAEGDVKTPYFRFKMTSSVKETEIIYYRVTTSKLIYETDGVPSNYYVLFADVNTIINNVRLLLDGKDVPR